MKRLLQFLVLSCLLAAAGCKAPDPLFALLGDHYTDGTTISDKYSRYNARLEQNQNTR
jgi:hypothetical protein